MNQIELMREIQICSAIIADSRMPDLKRHTAENQDEAILEMILEVCADAFFVDESQVLSKTRKADPTAARQTAMWLARKHTGLTLRKIGERIGCRDHSTVIHSADKIDDLLFTNDRLSVTIRGCENRVASLMEVRV